ncbi:TIGR00730 family Rossman fold protein [Thalassospiraceae bacterium LMO-SO8]|nr:TIGR00730 family Rossman fold protein [Alphaproteobacteria bacterium LMO-S08]WND76635.1 TIGR00730 family Rossman fold protein [Thalassospiraceae bacterium LMO-SO8]
MSTGDDFDPEKPYHPPKAYRNERFLTSPSARGVRILAEYVEPAARFRAFDVADTVVFFGSARILPRDEAEHRLRAARDHGGDVVRAETALEMSRYYEDARELARRLTEWSKGLEDTHKRFIVCSGGGPGIMEAANRGASEARGINIGLGISLPHEQHANPYITREMSFEFHYFFMRKLWFMYLAKALIVFPGGFGSMDELFETLTLIQTGKIKKYMPVVLYGRNFWDEVLNLDALVKYGTINAEDVDLLHVVDTVDDAFAYITGELSKSLDAPKGPGL